MNAATDVMLSVISFLISLYWIFVMFEVINGESVSKSTIVTSALISSISFVNIAVGYL